MMPGRKFSAEKYRFGYQGQEIDLEVKGSGNSLDFGERIYDPRTAKFLSVDPLTRSFPWYTPYQYAGNNPIANIDLDGRESLWFMDWYFSNLMQAKQENPDAEAIELAAKVAGNMLTDVLSNTDLNDATVISTAINRGPNKAINFDGKPADKTDLSFATFGAIVPFVSGSLLKSGLTSFKNWVLGSADEVNDVYKANGFYSPYKAGTEILEFQTSKTEKFVRVFGEGGNAQGSWMMKEVDLLDDTGKMLSPKDIQNKFSLPGLPNKILDVTVPANTIMRSGEAGPVGKLGTQGGGTQFELLDEIPQSSYGTPRDL